MDTPRYQKIAIWGSVAMGKTTLAKELSNRLNIPNVIFTDEILYTNDFSEIKNPDIEKGFLEPLKKPRWIIDGNLGEYVSRKEIIEMSDIVIILNLPFYKSLIRMIIKDTKPILDLSNLRKLHSVSKSVNFVFNSIHF